MSDSNQLLFIPHCYVVTPGTALTGNASTITPLLTDQDADFELHELFATSSLDTAADIRPNNFLFQIADKTNGRNWSDALIPQAVAARVPGGWKMWRPVLIARRSNLAITFTNLSGSANTPTLTFIGHKVLAYSG